jgi:deoxyribonuclease V
LVAGTDLAFTRDGLRCIAAVVVWDRRSRRVIEQQLAFRDVTFPYVPGLLSFREAPAVLAALRKVRNAPDALMCDGHGLAHPRRFGIASHIGIIVGLPTIGCAKTRLIGRHEEPGLPRGSSAALLDQGERIGTVLRTRDGVRPVYVSVGHNIDLTTAQRVVLNCAIKYRLPEPTRLADQVVAQVR